MFLGAEKEEPGVSDDASSVVLELQTSGLVSMVHGPICVSILEEVKKGQIECGKESGEHALAYWRNVLINYAYSFNTNTNTA